MTLFKRRHVLHMLGVAVAALAAGGLTAASAQERKSVRIGYAVSKTGPNAGGAGITTIPNYVLWVKDVNDAGGLEMPDGSKLPIEVIEYDDRSSAEEVVRAVERLATQDKVDFMLVPWGTGFNLAVAPLFDRFGYPQLAVSAVTDKAPEFVKRWKKSFWMLGGGHDYAKALAKVLVDANKAGTINNKVAMISIADGFGIDLVTAARPAFQEAGMQESIKRKGLDREAVSQELSTGTFKTVLGDTKLEDNQLRQLWWTGQWQNGQFVGIDPSDRSGASKAVLPRQPWKAQ